MTRKTESLAYPLNPLDAIRELQELDAEPIGHREGEKPKKGVVEALPTSSKVANATSSEETSATSIKKRAPRKTKASGTRSEPPVRKANAEQEEGDSPEGAIEALRTSSAVADATSSEEGSAVASATGSEESSVTSPKTQKRRRPKPNGSNHELTDEANPLAAAIKEMLSRPYTADPKKGPFTVSTVKIPAEISERLGWVASLTARPKQEILADALKDYFSKVLREGVEG